MDVQTKKNYLCAWSNDAAREVKPSRVNCWLKTISNPPRWPALRLGLREFLEALLWVGPLQI